MEFLVPRFGGTILILKFPELRRFGLRPHSLLWATSLQFPSGIHFYCKLQLLIRIVYLVSRMDQ